MRKIYTFILAVFLAALLSACHAGIVGLSSNGTGGGNGGGEASGSLTAPTAQQFRAAVIANNPNGIIVGRALGQITLPECTVTGDVINVVYSLTGLPAWVSFDAATRIISLADGVPVIPADAVNAYAVTFGCSGTIAAADISKFAKTEGETVSDAMEPVTINDLDGGGVVDATEWVNSEVPLVNNVSYIRLTPDNVAIYRGEEGNRIPTGILTEGFDTTDSTDDAGDNDGDGVLNVDETDAGTNMFIAATTGIFSIDNWYATSNGPAWGVAGDGDGDGDIDIFVANDDGATVSIMERNSDTIFTRTDFDDLITTRSIALADFNDDGSLDFIVAEDGTKNVHIYLKGSSGWVYSQSAFYVAPENVLQVIVGDFNGDNNHEVDFFVTWDNDPDGGNGGVSFVPGNGDGTFGTAKEYNTVINNPQITTADFDNDGDLDIAVAGDREGSFSLLVSNGDGTFKDPQDILVGADVLGPIAAADFNNDGNIDLAIAESTVATVQVLMGNADLTFDAAVPYDVGAASSAITVADIDGDNDVDIATADNNAGSHLSILLNNGDVDGTFAAEADHNTEWEGARAIVPFDFAGDGYIALGVLYNNDSVLQMFTRLQQHHEGF